MDEQKQRMLELLQSNKGFIHPHRWIEYGLLHGFKRIQAEELHECPDCRCESFAAVGQYVYYSTVVRLQECTQCGLLFSDKRIDPKVIQLHFERAYKDEEYFHKRRSRIFAQISALADLAAVQRGNVLDIGGAKGHLLATLKKRRPDLHLVLNDLSKEACDYVAQTHGFQSLCGDAIALQASSSRYDVIIMSDVFYYATELRKQWRVLAKLVAKNGVVIIRVPNKYHLIRLWQFMICLVKGRAQLEMQNHIKFFNPEHLYVFTRRYLETRFKGLGFVRVSTVPSELLVGRRADVWQRLYFRLCKVLFILSCGKWILTPSMLVIASNGDRDVVTCDRGSQQFVID